MTARKAKAKNVLHGEGESRVRAIRLAVTYWDRLAAIAKASGTSVNGEISKAVKRHIEEEKA